MQPTSYQELAKATFRVYGSGLERCMACLITALLHQSHNKEYSLTVLPLLLPRSTERQKKEEQKKGDEGVKEVRGKARGLRL